MHHQALIGVAALALVAGLLRDVASAAPAAKLTEVEPEAFARKVVAPGRGSALLVNFWATWCEPCREEMPILLRAAAGHRIRVILVSLDSVKAKAKVRAFLRSVRANGPSFIAAPGDPERFIDAVDPSWDGTVPYTLLYGPDGTILSRLRGEQEAAELERAIGAVAPRKR